ncbi:flavoprotein-like protein, partial [Schizophyllum fasciatum]
MAPKVAIIIYTMYGHIGKMAEAVKAGVASAGGEATIFQIPETLPQEVLEKLHAPSKPSFPTIDAKTMATFDGLIFGIPTRYGNFPGQWKASDRISAKTSHRAFWDTTGGLWASGGLARKFCSVFVSTGTPGGGQEMTVANAMSTFVHHGIIFVPL